MPWPLGVDCLADVPPSVGRPLLAYLQVVQSSTGSMVS